jgi:hypothetical protein
MDWKGGLIVYWAAEPGVGIDYETNIAFMEQRERQCLEPSPSAAAK